MILDSSALITIVFKEPGYEAVVLKLGKANAVGIGAPTLAEAGIVLSARVRADTRGLLARFLQDFQINVIPFGEAHCRAAVDAYEKFGKGRHPAGLNFGDCMSYATARLADQPLLCVGDDFAKTDLVLA